MSPEVSFNKGTIKVNSTSAKGYPCFPLVELSIENFNPSLKVKYFSFLNFKINAYK